jgi:hypothetical protein
MILVIKKYSLLTFLDLNTIYIYQFRHIKDLM